MKLNRVHKQSGASLMEVLVAMTISLVVTASMIAMMSNSLGSTARIIKMTKLQDDMRVAMQMMSRDIRRGGYNAGAQYCYANNDCDSDAVTIDGAQVDINIAGDIVFNDANDCFTFSLDRDHDFSAADHDVERINDSFGGFRQVTKANSSGNDVGVIQMWTGSQDSTPDCGENPLANPSNWVDITNPDNMDIYDFSVDDDLSYTEEILNNGVEIVNQRIRKVRMDMKGQLVLDNSIRREIIDVIDVRNDVIL